MAHPALQPLRRAACVLLLAAAASALTPALARAGGSGSGGDADVTLAPSTRRPHLDRADVARAARAFGIDTAPERTTAGWEAQDDVRELYLNRAPSGWYVQFSDSTTLLGPAGDRATICAAPEAPYGCTVPGVQFVADVGGVAPDAATAAAVAERVLRSSGLQPGRWDVLVLDPGRDAVPCRDGLQTGFACLQQVVPTRAVMLTHDLGEAPAARWGVIVGPRATVLTAVGRVARPLTADRRG